MPGQLHFSVTFVRNLAWYATTRGVPVERILAAAGLPAELLSDPDAMVGGPACERAWQAVEAETGDPCLGLHMGDGVQPADLGIVGFAMMSCHNLRAALDKLIRHWSLMSNATLIALSVAGDTATLELRVLNLPGNFCKWNRHPVESSFSAGLSLMQAMVGQPVQLLSVAFQYPPPGDVREYERILGCRPVFGETTSFMTFPAEFLRLPLRHANPTLMSALEAQMEQRKAELSPTTLRDRVRHEVARRLRAEVPDLETVAQAIGMSERVLQRDLQAEGTTFRKVLDELRRDLAAEYLAEGRHSIADVAFLLGFSEPSVLHRYFRRWFGTTPVLFRREQQREPVAG